MQSSFIPANLYNSVYLVVVGFIAYLHYLKIKNLSVFSLQKTKLFSESFILLLTCIVVLFIGTRPLAGAFTDMFAYTDYYLSSQMIDTNNEPGFLLTANLGHLLGLSVESWFTFIAAIFFGCNLLASRSLDKVNGELIYLTILVSFLTFAYSTNTIRSGMAHSILLLAISLYLDRKKNKLPIVSIVCFIYAFSVHKSIALGLICFFLAYYIVGLRRCFQFWFLSIFFSLFVGNQVANLFQGLGFDDRLDKYLIADDFTGFSHTGFRWDFLFYSAITIILGYYITIKRKIENKKYSILLSTYLLANAFWIMVIRAQFSDRFAYLSWFLYPVVLSYPLLKMDIWGRKQGVCAYWILLGHLSFTLFMHFIYS